MTKSNTPAAFIIGGSTKAIADAAIAKVIASIQKRGQSLQNDIHRAAVSVLAHTEAHGDITLANRLLDALPGMARKNALADWFVAFGKFTANKDDKNGMLAYNGEAVTMIAEATKLPFWEFKKEQAWVPFDFDKAVSKLLKQAATARTKGQENLPEERIASLRALLSAEAQAAL